MATKIIFLDIDGVLNSNKSTSICTSIEDRKEITGIDSDKLKRLKKIVAGTGAIIVLTSTWKIGWERFNKEREWSHARYMDKKFDKYGMRIYDCTKDVEKGSYFRGLEILEWLKNNFAPDEKVNWIILDDYKFDFFENEETKKKVILTDPDVGLTDEQVDLAIEMLGGNNGS